jgi:hypothetical protein
VTLALYGTFSVRAFVIAASATFGSRVGGSLIDSLTLVLALTTLPAIWIGGRPSAPVTDKFAPN